jgi:DNA-directed RNA polymerase II subunit RPB2
MDNSDNFRVFTCKKCGIISIVNTDKNKYNCKSCRNYSTFSQIRIPYACKLLFQELASVNILSRIKTEKSIYTDEM